MQASLVMRDKETDSWWSIMTSKAIGGPMDGQDLVELPYGEKSTWGDWVRRYPQTKVLSVNGKEHEERNPYDRYFTSDGTFRDLKVADDRLAAKTAIYSFRLGGQAYAAPNKAYEGGKLFAAEELGEGKRLFLYREKGASVFASTLAYVVDAGVKAKEVLRRVEAQDTEGFEPVEGFDTFWYNWVAVNKDSKLLR